MDDDRQSQNRMLLNMEHAIRTLNREIINPMIPPLNNDHVLPVMTMVARVRGAYLKELFAAAASSEKSFPSNEQLKRLRYFREAYEELSAAAQALETAIQRGYLDVKS